MAQKAMPNECVIVWEHPDDGLEVVGVFDGAAEAEAEIASTSVGPGWSYRIAPIYWRDDESGN